MITSSKPLNSSGLVSGSCRPNAVQAVEVEILREKAEALGRTGQRLEEALGALEEVREAIEGLELRLRHCNASSEEVACLQKAHSELIARLRHLRRRAHHAYQFLIIHREAVGLRDHLEVERCYKISERLR